MGSRRGLEVLTALLTGTFGVAILVSSLRLGIGWSRDGVGTGTFPAIAGGLTVLASLYNLVRGALTRGPTLLDGARFKRIVAIFVPAAIFVALIPLLGLHAAAGVYVFAVIAMQKRMALWKAAAIGLATPFVLYSIFDWSFQVTLLRGLLGDKIGY